MRAATRVRLCIALSTALLLGMSVCAYFAALPNKLLAVGPAADLELFAVPINTWPRYWMLLVILSVFRSANVIIADLGAPNMAFTIYDPTKETVYGFSRIELQLSANSMFMVLALNNAISTNATVTRLDVVLVTIISSELASAFSIHYLLGKKKKFVPECDTVEEHQRLLGSDGGTN